MTRFYQFLAAVLPIFMLIVLFTYEWGHSLTQDIAVGVLSALGLAGLIYWIWRAFKRK